jgi:phenylacetate-coenzyme A ligase PaaK-like adenylate-forming protein
MKEIFDLPTSFENWDHFDRIVPIMDKNTLRSVLNCVSLSSSQAKSFVWRSTGGSTGEPFRFPTYSEEIRSAALDIWLGRARLGIDPDDPLFLLWGHAHLMGSGFKGLVNQVKRHLSDALLGYTRVSAYNLSEADLATAYRRLLSACPSYVVGYSSALDRFARFNAKYSEEIAALNLKAVVATAESFPAVDSRSRISAVFGAPVFMEYGSIETGPLAYERTDNSFDVFHVRHRLSCRGGTGPNSNEILVTSLGVRAMPLMRYALGDLAVVSSENLVDGSILKLHRVIGRCNDIVLLPNGSTIHSEAFTHCVRDLTGIEIFQIVAPNGKWPWLRYVAQADLPKNTTDEIRRRLAVISPELVQMRLERVDDLPLSIAGKHQMVVQT